MSTLRPETLPLDAGATVWSVPQNRVNAALDERPLLVLLHGFGSNEADLAGLMPHLPAEFVIASLRAPLPVDVGAGRGYAWFPITDPGRPDPAYLDAGVRGIRRWLEHTHARVRTPGPVALLGFSQGGAMVTHLLRHNPEDYACGVVLSGFTAGGLVAGDEALSQIRPPVFWGRDDADPVITADAVMRTTAFLTSHVDLTERRYPGAGHGVAAAELADVARFLRDHVGVPGS
ncbi:alpha/beta hydrolase [Occultella gossypii]|uniref:Dienelactone hydrolase family protein n=1 Tax=Occultella gossypii TaxID=2800820 RepID=A0ABS7S2X8_9MICO|nr:dienelactone hydrolase family protein [Occultella gossypii]MBZ2194688.1 dienelactone hydrolase family protein [Occultella gossypii]